MKAVLYLADGTIFRGQSFGARGDIAGEVVFNTSMTGYQEILTDPSYYGQIVTMTYPQIGNYGVNKDDVQSCRIHSAGFVVREYFDYFSNWRAEKSLEDYLLQFNIIGISEVDTRMLTRHIRLEGAMKGVISTETDNEKKLKSMLDAHPDITGEDLVKHVSCKNHYIYNPEIKKARYHVVCLDFGVKFNSLRHFNQLGFKTTILPADAGPGKILKFEPDGIFLSNGPGDPAAVTYAIENIREILGKKPIFGICMGHQLLALAGVMQFLGLVLIRKIVNIKV